jgi:DivIVA domain-containing protein
LRRKPSEAERNLARVSKERFRRALRGYDPEEVDAAIQARDARLARLEREAQRLAERVVDREKKLQEALKKPVAAAAETNRVALSRALASIEEIYGQARRQATRIRMKALEDAVLTAERVKELTRLRDELGARVAELAEVARARLRMEEDEPMLGALPAGASADGMYAGRVEVEVGPLSDFAQLTRFEDAAAGIRGASDIHVKRFSRGRATVSMDLADPVKLLRELEERAPFDFIVRDIRRDGLVLDVKQDLRGQQDRRAA